MASKKLAIAACLLLSTISHHSIVKAVTQTSEYKESINSKSSTARSYGYESNIGWHLARCLIGGHSVFIGTVQEIIEPEREAELKEPPSSPSSKIIVIVDEWIWGQPPQGGPQILLDQVPVVTPHGLVSAHRDDDFIWKDAHVEVGKRLLIVFSPAKSPEKTEVLNKIDRYGLVLSDESFFPAIQFTMAAHARYTNNPDNMSDALTVINSRSDKVFSGYLVSYLRVRAGENPNTDAAIISQLIGNPHIHQALWRFLEPPLVRAMTEAELPLSETIRWQVMERLVEASCSTNAMFAETALKALVRLSEKQKFDISTFLTGDQQQKIIRNYKSLIPAKSISEGQGVFESHLGIKQQ